MSLSSFQSVSLAQIASRPGTSTQHVHSAVVVARIASRTFLAMIGVAWYDHFVVPRPAHPDATLLPPALVLLGAFLLPTHPQFHVHTQTMSLRVRVRSLARWAYVFTLTLAMAVRQIWKMIHSTSCSLAVARVQPLKGQNIHTMLQDHTWGGWSSLHLRPTPSPPVELVMFYYDNQISPRRTPKSFDISTRVKITCGR